MKIGSCQRHIAQARDAEDPTVSWHLGEEKAPQINGASWVMRGRRFLQNAEFLEHTAPDINALMTGNTAIGLEMS